MIWDLPTSLTVNGAEYEIRTDFRDILRIMTAYQDPELDDREKVFITLQILYVDQESIPQEDLQEAYRQAVWFMDMGEAQEKKTPSPRTMDWEQDAKLIFAAVNRSAGTEVRASKYMHWWTFMSYFMEIKDTTYSTVLSIRGKKARGKKLDDWEKDYYKSNKDLIRLEQKYTEAEKDEQAKLLALLD